MVHHLVNKITPEMVQSTNDKFNAWDRVIREELFDKEGCEREVYSLLKDPTIYMYAFFKNKDGGAMRLYTYQDIIINDVHKKIIFAAANQIGKSVTLCCKALHFALLNPGKTVLMTSKTMPQSKDLLREIKRLLQSSVLDYKAQIGDSENKTEIYFKHYDSNGLELSQSRIICVPATEAALGYPADLLLEDELAFYDNGHYFHFQIAQPRTYTTKGQIMTFSNPNGRQGIYWELWGDEDYDRYNFNFLDCPTNTVEEYDKLKAKLTQEEFDSTVAGVFTAPARGYFSRSEIDGSLDEDLSELKMVGKQPFFFLDVGAKHDQCVLIGGFVEKHQDWELNELMEAFIPIIKVYPVGYPISRVAGVDVDEGDGWHFEKPVKDYLSEWQTEGVQPIFGYDITGNEGMRALFEAMKIYALDINFAGPNKSGYYQRFKYFMEKGLLHRVKCDDWVAQASTLIVTKSARGYLLINAASKSASGGAAKDAKLKKIPDDCMDATAGFIHLADDPDYIPYSIKII